MNICINKSYLHFNKIFRPNFTLLQLLITVSYSTFYKRIVSMSLLKSVSEWVIPKTEASGCFGPACRIAGYKNDPDHKGEDQFSSTVQFITLNVNASDVLKKIDVVIKLQPVSQVLRESLRSKDQFYNEVLMYSKILPMIDKYGIVEEKFCKYYYGMAEPDLEYEKDFVMLEDLSKKGFRLASEKIHLDYDHCVLAMKQIGKFHALSYAFKKENHSELLSAVSNIKEKWTVERLTRWKYLLALCGQRGILPLIEEKKSVQLLENFLKNYDDPVKFYSSLINPVEPEAVLCHGDFCRNNMLFLYNNVGKPISVKFFDLQTPRYSSPVIDLSFFLLMNGSKEVLENYWDDLLNVYQQSLKSTIPDIDIPDLDFKRVAIYGYLHCSFFLPIMLADEQRMPFEEFLKLSPYEQGVSMSQTGGINETKLLVYIIEFMLKKQYIRETYY